MSEAAYSERFWGKVEKTGGCWLWQRGRSTEGYGLFAVKGKSILAHRVAYELVVGPIPEGLQIDHLCRVRHCVNPAHMEPVSRKENILRGENAWAKNARKTHCPKGHPYNGDNLRVTKGGARVCVYCDLARHRHHETAVCVGPRQALVLTAMANGQELLFADMQQIALRNGRRERQFLSTLRMLRGLREKGLVEKRGPRWAWTGAEWWTP